MYLKWLYLSFITLLCILMYYWESTDLIFGIFPKKIIFIDKGL